MPLFPISAMRVIEAEGRRRLRSYSTTFSSRQQWKQEGNMVIITIRAEHHATIFQGLRLMVAHRDREDVEKLDKSLGTEFNGV
ncbi:hypothetical protein NQ315_013051 [Exocentrus adspersus]|uniref:Uncharacterized protein n=1 Tax=Exocentrus adspersus TaxID=1586481 RepID=A0AAV8VXC5_9CUCU|nr:hypothetical protein NQ315_013051 [Exocentrus adspersus]